MRRNGIFSTTSRPGPKITCTSKGRFNPRRCSFNFTAKYVNYLCVFFFKERVFGSSLESHRPIPTSYIHFMVFVHIPCPPCGLICFAQGGDILAICRPFNFSFYIRVVHGPALHSHIAVPRGVSCLIQICAMAVYGVCRYIWAVYLLLLHQLEWFNVGRQLSRETLGHPHGNI